MLLPDTVALTRLPDTQAWDGACSVADPESSSSPASAGVTDSAITPSTAGRRSMERRNTLLPRRSGEEGRVRGWRESPPRATRPGAHPTTRTYRRGADPQRRSDDRERAL